MILQLCLSYSPMMESNLFLVKIQNLDIGMVCDLAFTALKLPLSLKPEIM